MTLPPEQPGRWPAVPPPVPPRLLQPPSPPPAAWPVDPPRLPIYFPALLPAGLAAFNVIWFGIVVFYELFTKGKLTDAWAKSPVTSIVCMIPSLVGLPLGIGVIVRRRTRRMIDHVLLYVGCAACALGVFMFTNELLS